MRADQSKEFKIGEKFEWREEPYRPDRSMQRGPAYNPATGISLGVALRRLLRGLGKMLVAVRYSLSKWGGFPKFHLGSMPFLQQIPWWKLGLAALAVFIILKKDIQLSIDMKAPLGAAPRDDDGVGTSEGLEEFGIAQSVAQRDLDDFRPASAEELDNDRVRKYVERFSPIAVSEMKKFGIPASIKMAQALVESHAGDHPASRQLNNHFGRPFAGHRFENAWDSWREHSLMLYHKYQDLFKSGSDYKDWAKALRHVSYSTDRRYDRKLIQVVEKYQLYLLDAE